MVRFVIALLWLPVLAYAFAARICSEIKSGLWFAWNDVCSENDALIERWRRNSFFPED